MKKVNIVYWAVTITGFYIFLNIFTGNKGIIWFITGLALILFGAFHIILRFREAESEEKRKAEDRNEEEKKSVFVQTKAKAFSYDFMVFMTDISILVCLFFDQTPIVLALIGVLIFQSILYHLSKEYFGKKY